MAAPPLNAEGRRVLARLRAQVADEVAAAGHRLEWLTTFTTSDGRGDNQTRAQDGWCRRCHRLRAVIFVNDPAGEHIAYHFGRPSDPCTPRG